MFIVNVQISVTRYVLNENVRICVVRSLKSAAVEASNECEFL